jgi:hypothetical protein
MGIVAIRPATGAYRRHFHHGRIKQFSLRGVMVEGCTFGVASGLIYVDAVLIARGTYAYLQMAEVLNLVAFTVSLGSQLLAFNKCSSFILCNSIRLLILCYSPTYCKVRPGNE